MKFETFFFVCVKEIKYFDFSKYFIPSTQIDDNETISRIKDSKCLHVPGKCFPKVINATAKYNCNQSDIDFIG